MAACDDLQPAATEAMIRQMARPLGFAFLGLTPAQATERAGYIRKWLAAGRHGRMAYLAQHLDERLDPARFCPGARSVIAVADRHPASDARQAPGTGAEPSGRIARYAWGDDYHQIIKKRLHELADRLETRWPGYVYRSCVDTAPVLEREQAQRAGLGWIGKHTLLIHPRAGSWLLLGQIVTTLPIRLEGPAEPIGDHCGTCRRCIDACPTQCIAPQGYQLDAARCISYLTIEQRGPIEPHFHAQMGDWIAGCDVCQEVCPFNQGRGDGQAPSRPEYQARPPAPRIGLLEVLNWDAPMRRDAFKRSALKRIKLDPFKRNALIAAGNSLRQKASEPLRQRIGELATDPGQSDLVRTTARQVLERLGQPAPDRNRPRTGPAAAG